MILLPPPKNDKISSAFSYIFRSALTVPFPLIGGLKMPLKIKPCHLRAAREYVSRYHRHSIPPVGGKFAVACYDGVDLCGVAICGRPVVRYLDDGADP